jgi:hypothetical protein
LIVGGERNQIVSYLTGLTRTFGEYVTLAFHAKYVSCADAIGGEILQVSFETIPAGQDEIERTTPYVLISRNFEFPGSATIEWHDGKDYDGGAEIISMTLRRDRVSIVLKRELDIDVTFHLPNKQFAKLTSFLRMMIDDRVCFSE